MCHATHSRVFDESDTLFLSRMRIINAHFVCLALKTKRPATECDSVLRYESCVVSGQVLFLDTSNTLTVFLPSDLVLRIVWSVVVVVFGECTP